MGTRGNSDRRTLTRDKRGQDSLCLPVANVPERPWQVALEALRIRSSWLGPVQQPPTALIQRYQETDALTRTHALPVRFFGYAPLFKGTYVYQALECDWAIMSLPEDPFFDEHKGRLYAPRSVIRDLKRFSAVGLSFDAIFIAHEVPPDSVRPGEPVPLELIAPPPTRSARERLSFIGKASLWGTIAKWLGAAATHVSAGLAALAARDPVLFGVQFDETWQLDGQPIGMWYYLARWFWDEREKRVTSE